MDRWIVVIPSSTGEVYRQSLASLKAIVAFPEGKSEYRVFRDLDNKTSKLEGPKELNNLQRIFWALEDNDDRGPVRELGKALGLQDPPRRGFVFIPREFEEQLLKEELAHAKLTEEEVNKKGLETRFSATRDGDKWTVKVVRQQPRK
jgi:hypothetical protein